MVRTELQAYQVQLKAFWHRGMKGCKTSEELKLLHEAVAETGLTNKIVEVLHSHVFPVSDRKVDLL
jgi:hypothetical protein